MKVELWQWLNTVKRRELSRPSFQNEDDYIQIPVIIDKNIFFLFFFVNKFLVNCVSF